VAAEEEPAADQVITMVLRLTAEEEAQAQQDQEQQVFRQVGLDMEMADQEEPEEQAVEAEAVGLLSTITEIK
jgi:hypothetical protein